MKRNLLVSILVISLMALMIGCQGGEAPKAIRQWCNRSSPADDTTGDDDTPDDGAASQVKNPM